MARFVFRNGIFVDRQTGVPMDKPYAGRIVAPNVISDIPEYRSPVDGRLIGSRSERRDDLKGDSGTPRTLVFGNQFTGETPEILDVTNTKYYLLTIRCMTATRFVVSAQVSL